LRELLKSYFLNVSIFFSLYQEYYPPISRYKRVYKKNAKQYSVYARKTPKSYSYIGELQTLVVRCRLESDSGIPRKRTQRPDDPRRLGLLPPVPPPPTAELVQRQVRRGVGMLKLVWVSTSKHTTG